MKKSNIKLLSLAALGALFAVSCSNEKPPIQYFPDMYYPVAYDPLMKATLAYSDHENEIPAFASGATALTPPEGTVYQNKDKVLPAVIAKNAEEYNDLYKASMTEKSPLNPDDLEKDLARGKKLFEMTCGACHGVAGDGNGPIVASGAYSGVPNYKDRDITVGSIHYVINNGKNAMGSYAGQLQAGDRWRVAMYVMNEFKKDAKPVAAAAPAAPAAAEPAKEVK